MIVFIGSSLLLHWSSHLLFGSCWFWDTHFISESRKSRSKTTQILKELLSSCSLSLLSCSNLVLSKAHWKFSSVKTLEVMMIQFISWLIIQRLNAGQVTIYCGAALSQFPCFSFGQSLCHQCFSTFWEREQRTCMILKSTPNILSCTKDWRMKDIIGNFWSLEEKLWSLLSMSF